MAACGAVGRGFKSLWTRSFIGAFMWVSLLVWRIDILEKTNIIKVSELDPWILFLNAMRTPMTRDRYQTRLAKFFDSIGIPGNTLEEKARTFAKKGKNDVDWTLSNIVKFVYYQRERVDKKEISGGTVRNYFQRKINLLSKMMGIKPNKVVIKNLKNRWASITKNNDINLNVNLIKAPPEIIDYIIIHELCHFKIKGHSYNFWNLIRRYFPDYLKFIKWLNINGKNLLS